MIARLIPPTIILALPSIALAHPGHAHPAGPAHDHLLEAVGYVIVALAVVALAKWAPRGIFKKTRCRSTTC